MGSPSPFPTPSGHISRPIQALRDFTPEGPPQSRPGTFWSRSRSSQFSSSVSSSLRPSLFPFIHTRPSLCGQPAPRLAFSWSSGCHAQHDQPCPRGVLHPTEGQGHQPSFLCTRHCSEFPVLPQLPVTCEAGTMTTCTSQVRKAQWGRACVTAGPRPLSGRPPHPAICLAPHGHCIIPCRLPSPPV